jgi:hypothetical protein
MKSQIPIRIKVKSKIRIRIRVKVWSCGASKGSRGEQRMLTMEAQNRAEESLQTIGGRIRISVKSQIRIHIKVNVGSDLHKCEKSDPGQH